MTGSGTQTTVQDNELPQWYQEAAVDRINMGKLLGQTGYIPYAGPDVAAFNGSQMAGMQNTSDMASAFGLSNPGNVADSMPAPQDFGGGMSGYSSFPMYEQVLNAFRSAYPAQADYYSSFFMDPISGQPPVQAQAQNNDDDDHHRNWG